MDCRLYGRESSIILEWLDSVSVVSTEALISMECRLHGRETACYVGKFGALLLAIWPPSLAVLHASLSPRLFVELIFLVIDGSSLR